MAEWSTKPHSRSGTGIFGARGAPEWGDEVSVRVFIAVVIAALGIASVPPIARADTALMLGGTPIPSYLGWIIETPVYPFNAQYFAQYTFKTVPYPQTIGPFSGIGTPTMGQSVATGKVHLDAAIHGTGGPMLVIGNSQGSLPTDAVRAKLENDPDAPPRSQLSFLVNGDPEQRGGLFNVLFAPGAYVPILDYTVLGPVESRYDLVVFTFEYDGIADFPDRPWNLLADLNALFGVAYRHAATGSLNPYAIPDEDITITTNSKGATTTTYLGRAEHLPLTEPLRRLGVSADLLNAVDSVLRPIIDRGYSRNDSGPFRGPILSGGQLHWPAPTPPTQPAPAAQQLATVPLAAAIEDTAPSTEADGSGPANTAERPARPEADAGSAGDHPEPSAAAQESEKPTKRPATKKRPALNVVRDSLTSTKAETNGPADAGPEKPNDQGGEDVVKADPPSADSTPSPDSAESGGTGQAQDREVA
jgi:PE-PPE domain